MLNELLDGGLGVSVYSKQGMESIGIDVCVGYGILSEPRKAFGLAHFLEHMMFKGTAKRSCSEINDGLRRIGNNANAATMYEYTDYIIRCHKNYFETALGIISDMLSNSTFEKEGLENERNTVLSEICKWEQDPNYLAGMQTKVSLFEDERFGHMGQGDAGSVKSIQREDLCKAYAENYRARNSHVAVYGAVDERTALKQVAEKFSGYSGGLKKANAPVTPRKVARRIRIEKGGTSDALVKLVFSTEGYGIHMKNIGKKVATRIAAEILRHRLFSELRDKRGLSYSVGKGEDTCSSFGCTVFSAGTKKKSQELVKELMLKECEKVERGEISQEEVSDAAEALFIQKAFAFENTYDTARALSYFGFIGKPELLDSSIAAIKEVSIDDVREAASKYFKTGTCGIVELVPKADA